MFIESSWEADKGIHSVGCGALDKTIRRTLGLEVPMNDTNVIPAPRGMKRKASESRVDSSATAGNIQEDSMEIEKDIHDSSDIAQDANESDDEIIHLHRSKITLTVDAHRHCDPRVVKYSQQAQALSEMLDLLSGTVPEGKFLNLVGKLGIGAQGWITTETSITIAAKEDCKMERLLQLPEAKSTPEQTLTAAAAGFGEKGHSSDWISSLCSLVASNLLGGKIFDLHLNLSVAWQSAKADEVILGAIKQDLVHLSVFHQVLLFKIDLEVKSSVARLCSPLDPKLSENFRLVMHTIFPRSYDLQQTAIDENPSKQTTLRTFYENLLPAPRVPLHALYKVQPTRLGTELLDFQKRSVAFVLSREGATQVDPFFQCESSDPFGFWEDITIGDTGKIISFCRLTGTTRPSKLSGMSKKKQGKLPLQRRGHFDREPSHETSVLSLNKVRGSILADEMGLGKTLEVISVILLNPGPDYEYQPRSSTHPDQDSLHIYLDRSSQLVQRVKATLIVVPASLMQQWLDEFQKHAPDVKVIQYRGWKKLEANFSKKTETAGVKLNLEEVDLEKPAQSFKRHIIESNVEVVITDFASLQTDFDVRQPPPKRPRRDGIDYVARSEQPRSPIVTMHWWRLIIDETQLADPAGTTKVAETMRVIPRTYSLAVSGTPAKTNTNDLYGSLHFIGLPLNIRQWQNLQRNYFYPAFVNLFERVCIRTTKKQLKGTHGLQEAPAKYIVPVELTPVEMQYYLEALEDAFESLKITPDGFPAVAPWYLDIVKLGSAIHLLRQTCSLGVHIAAQGRNKARAARGGMDAHAHKQLMTMSDALENMQWEAQNTRWSNLRELAALQLEKAQMLGRLLSMATRGEAVNSATQMSMKERPDEKLLIRIWKELAVHVTALQDEANRLAPGCDDPEESESEDPPGNLQEASARHRAISYRGRRKDFLMLKHRCCFLLGDVYHVVGNEEKEREAYSEATRIRQEDILKVAATRANRNVDLVAEAVQKSGVLGFPQLELDDMIEVGIYGRDARDAADATVGLLNDNAEHAWNWRGEIVRILNEPVDHDDEATGEEYQHTLKSQAMLEVYLSNYAAILADRRAIMHEERTLLAAHEGRIEKKRKTRAAKNAQADADGEINNVADISDDDEIEQLEIDLVDKRQRLRQAHSDIGRPLRAIQIELNAKANRAIVPEEVALTKAAVQSIRQTIKAQTEITQKLEDELDDFRKAFNLRVAYFRDLQALSDSVVEPNFGQVPLEAQLETTQNAMDALEKSLALGQARLRYLRSLGEQRSDSQDDKCVLCLTLFSEVAQLVLLKSCGHAICSDCFFLYRGTAAGNRCLLCRAPITAGDVQKVAVAQEPQEKRKDVSPQPQEAIFVDNVMPELSDAIFSMLPQRKKVEQTEILGLWSSKIAILTKNIALRQSRSPSTKHVVFSAWKDALVIVKAALDENDIRWIDLDDQRKYSDPVKTFTEDPDISVFLLHGERSTSGLTLTAASVVHLLEPLINRSFEAQAIGRIDRLGQKSKTEVYCYATKDTIESKILYAGLRQGTSIYIKDESDATSTVASGVAKRGGDDFSGSPDELLDLIL